MPIKSETLRKELQPAYFTTSSTSLGPVAWLPSVQISRTRSWSNSSLRTASQRAKHIMSQGYLPTQSYSDDLQHIVNSKPVLITGKWGSSNVRWQFIPNVPRMSVTASMADTLKARALENIQGQLSGVGVSVPLTIIDAGKTADMIGDAAGRLFKSYRHLRHGNFLAAAKALGLEQTPRRVGRHRSTEDNWLEYRYGWRLVVKDIESYMKQIHNMLTTRPIVHRVTSMKDEHVQVWKGRFTETRPAPVPNLAIRYEVNRVETRDVHASAGYVYAIESTALATGQQLGLLNLPALVWDVIPASFMFDWAANVSSVLEGLTAFQGKKFLDGWTCVAVHSKRTEYWTNIRNGYGFSYVAPSAFHAGPVEERIFRRSVLAGFTPARLRLDFTASFQNGLDGLALIKQIFSPKK